MPKPGLKNPFARRKSSGNVLETDAPVQSSFRVIERPEKNKIVFDGTDRNRNSQVNRPFSSPLQQLRGKSVDDLTYHANGSVDTAASRNAALALRQGGRISAGTTHSGSSEVYQSSSASARHSSSSTLPSSVDPEAEPTHDDDELFTKNRAKAVAQKLSAARMDEPLPPPPSFSARAQRAFSFGLRHKASRDRIDAAPLPADTTPSAVPPPTILTQSPLRERALTTSSYASTAVPTKLDTKPELSTADFGGDFGKMFDGRDEPLSAPAIVGSAHRTDSPPIFPPRSYAKNDYAASPTAISPFRLGSESPWERRNSRDGLLASTANSPNLSASQQPFADASHSTSRSSLASYATGPERPSEDSAEEPAKQRTYELRDPQSPTTTPIANGTTAPALTVPVASSPFGGSNPWERESSSATPKAQNRVSVVDVDEPLFDASPVGAASRAKRPALQSESAPRRLTKAQFEILQRYTDSAEDAAEHDSGNEYEDDDEQERAKAMTKQRQKQEANMSVYRQQMKKVTGGGPTDLPNRPNLDSRSTSSPSLHLGGLPAAQPPDYFKAKQTDNEDDDVPLGILQAHGFPSANRPPTRMDGMGGYRPSSALGQRSSQNLPPFARRLPEDPYFGASLVNPAARESLAFGSGASVYGGSPAPATPGGLVGIIAEEERQRQARRGSPNPATGTYNMPLPNNMPMPAMNRTSSMASMQAPAFYPPMQGMPVMPQMPMPGDPQMHDFMQMQMQFMQNMQAMLAMQQAQMQPQTQQPFAQGLPRPMSSVSNLLAVPGQPDQGRAMSMVGSSAGWTGAASGNASRASQLDPRMSSYAASVNALPIGGYTASIAPSERSNVGMPSRYRPVQTGEGDGRTNSLTSSMTLNALASQQPVERPVSQVVQQPKSTIRVIDKPKGLPKISAKTIDAEEDESGGWTDMFKKKTKRAGRGSKSGDGRVALSELYPNVE